MRHPIGSLKIDEQPLGPPKSEATPTVLVLSGHLDDSSHGPIVERLRAVMARGCHNIILDFRGVKYVTSAGFATLVALRESALQAGGDVVVLNATPNISILFRVLKLPEPFYVAPSLADAQRHFQSRQAARKN